MVSHCLLETQEVLSMKDGFSSGKIRVYHSLLNLNVFAHTAGVLWLMKKPVQR